MSYLHRLSFYLGCGILAAMITIHLITHFFTSLEAQNEDQERLLGLYRSIKFKMPMSQERTLNELMLGYSLYFPILFMAIILFLLTARNNPSMLKPTLQMVLLMLLALILTTHYYMINPPMIMMIFSFICFSITLFTMMKKSNS